jgi:hypothetical protein
MASYGTRRPLTRALSVYFNLSVIQRVRERCRLRRLNHATAATRATITKTRRTICSSVGVLMLKAVARPIICLCTQGLINHCTESWRAEAAILPSLLFLSATASSRLMTFRLVASSTLYWFLAWILFSAHVLSRPSSTVNSSFFKINLVAYAIYITQRHLDCPVRLFGARLAWNTSTIKLQMNPKESPKLLE